jgi:hypothetical protein
MSAHQKMVADWKAWYALHNCNPFFGGRQGYSVHLCAFALNSTKSFQLRMSCSRFFSSTTFCCTNETPSLSLSSDLHVPHQSMLHLPRKLLVTLSQADRAPQSSCGKPNHLCISQNQIGDFKQASKKCMDGRSRRPSRYRGSWGQQLTVDAKGGQQIQAY